jgi:hypothetical protein
MKSIKPFLTLIVLLMLFSMRQAFAADVCNKLTEAEISAAAGTQLTRSATDPCRFGKGMKSLSIIMHAGGGSQFDSYAAQAHKEFSQVEQVPGVGSQAIFYGFNLAVQYKADLFVVSMMLGSGNKEKIAISKAVALKVISHL